jgi:transporter family protein
LKESHINWLHWALLSALFAGLTAVLAKAGVNGIDSNLATAIRTVAILVSRGALHYPVASTR